MIQVPKRVAPLAVERSRLKRLIREAVRPLAAPPSGAAYRFTVRSKAPAGLKLVQVSQAVRDLIEGV